MIKPCVVEDVPIFIDHFWCYYNLQSYDMKHPLICYRGMLPFVKPILTMSMKSSSALLLGGIPHVISGAKLHIFC